MDRLLKEKIVCPCQTSACPNIVRIFFYLTNILKFHILKLISLLTFIVVNHYGQILICCWEIHVYTACPMDRSRKKLSVHVILLPVRADISMLISRPVMSTNYHLPITFKTMSIISDNTLSRKIEMC